MATKLHDEAPHDFVPLSVYRDSNCLFRAASLVATGDKQKHGQFHKLVMKELQDNAEYYTDLFLADTEDRRSMGQSISLLSQTLGDAPIASRYFSDCMESNMQLRDSYTATVPHGATIGEKSGVWSGMAG